MTIIDLHQRQRSAAEAPGWALRALPSRARVLGRATLDRVLDRDSRPRDLPAAADAGATGPTLRALPATGDGGSWEPTPEQRLRHDLRQSLGLLMALTDGVQRDLDHGTQVLAHLEQMRQETERMTGLVSAHLGAGTEPQRVEVGQVVAEVWRSAVAAAPCRMQLVCDAATRAVLDPVALTRSVQNLLDNAVRAAGDGGAVVVRVRDDGDTVTVTVSDTGPGFGNVPTQQGLGLVTVRRFAAECGGTLEVAGSRGGGAELVLRIPSAARSGEELTCAS